MVAHDAGLGANSRHNGGILAHPDPAANSISPILLSLPQNLRKISTPPRAASDLV